MQQIPGNPVQQTDGVQQPAQQFEMDDIAPKKRKGKDSGLKVLLRIVIALAVIAVGIFLILWIVASVGGYGSIGNLLQFLFGEISMAWQRITA